ncbi:hypothetical protein ACSYGO_36500 [Streptomyces krungchingensis]
MGTAIINPADRDAPVAAAEAPKPTGKITSLDGRAVGQSVILKGSIQHVPKGYALWAFVEVDSNHFYPTFSSCNIDDNGIDWHCPTVRPANSADPKDTAVTLHVALVDAYGAEAIGRYRQKIQAGMKADAFSDMTPGAIEIDDQAVVTK